MAEYRIALSLPHQNNNIYFNMGVLYEKKKMAKEAVQSYKQCLSIDQTHFGAAIHLAASLANLGEYPKAKKYFKHCIKLNQHSIPAHFGLAKILHHAEDDYNEALKHYRVSVARDPNHYKALCQMGNIFLAQQDLSHAAEYLKKCLKINPKYVNGMISMGNLLFESGHANNAIKYFEQALNYNPKEIQALIGLANALYEIGQTEDAIEYYQKVIEIDNEISDVYYNLANAQYLLNRIDEAVENYKKALQINP